MQQVIIAIHLMVVVALVVLVLYQKSEGGALGMGGGQGGFFTGRGQANALTRATGILATIFFLTSIALTVLPAWERRAQGGGDDWTKALDESDVKVKEVKPDAAKGDGKPAVPLPEPGKDSIFDQLQRAQQKRQQGGAPAAPEKPALRPTEQPATQPPAAVAPKVEAPKVEAPKLGAPNAEGPKAEAPSWLRSAPEAPKAPKAEAPKVETPKIEAPKMETPKTGAPAPAAPPPVQWKSPTQ